MIKDVSRVGGMPTYDLFLYLTASFAAKARYEYHDAVVAELLRRGALSEDDLRRYASGDQQ